jgi:Lon protease-like protein
MTLVDPSLRVPLESLAVFPLPNTVLLPEQRLPLHVFEPRYRQMVRDALDDAPYIVVARMEPGAAGGSFSQVATAGRIVAHQRLADGRYNILVEGAVRVAADEIPSDKLYRKVCCTALPEPREQDAEVAPTERAAMLSLVSLVVRTLRVRSPAVAFDPPMDLPPARLAFRVADRFVTDAVARQKILEADTARARVARTTEALAQTLNEVAPGISRGGMS